MKYAHYYASRKVKHVIISDNIRGHDGVTIPVSGKAEARAIAAQHNAKPWNF